MDNIQLYRGQHVQFVQRLNNDYCLVQLLNKDAAAEKQNLEVQIPISLIRVRAKLPMDGMNTNF